MRIGIGYDIHRIVSTEHESSIPIGGVKIPCRLRVEAHSDGDVLLHALVDACLGALALGDIGQWFPDAKAENSQRPSRDFVNFVTDEISKLGWRIVNVDSVVVLENPKLSAHRELICRNLAMLLNLELGQISVKAKTHEGLGAVGEGKALWAYCVVSLSEQNATQTHR